MTLLTATTNFTILDASPVVESVQLSVVAAAAPGTGKGRMIHPTLGSLDYYLAPHEWTSMGEDAIIAPIWTSQMTLSSSANTLWPGVLRDVAPEEHWLPNAGLSMPLPMLKTLIAFWMNPPDPAVGYIEWHPSYVTSLKFQVIITAIEVGGQPMTMSPQSVGTNLVEFPVTLKLRIVGRVA
jgi:hypothetical protein